MSTARTPPRPADRGRRLVPDQRELDQPHARRRDPDLRGAAAELRRPGRARARPPAARCRASARSWWCRRWRPGRPLWADDVNFNLTYHIRHTALPEPGGEAQLKRLAGRVFSQQLDRSKPLWELWLAQGLERDRFAILTKTHHAMVDGVSGVDIGTVLFDLEPVPEPAPVEDDWVPQPEPSTTELVARGVSRRGRGAGEAGRARGRGGAPPRDDGAQGGRGAGGRRARSSAPSPTRRPDVPLNQPIGPHRRYVWARSELATFKRIKDALGGTVNDVVLAVVTGALREWLHGRGIRTEGLELRALVPVSIRSEDERGDLGNRIAAMRGPLPVYVEDPVRRLRVDQRGDGGAEALQAGARRRSDLPLQRLRAADAAGAGLADQLLDPALQPDRHQRAGPADPALRARPRAGGGLPGRLPARRTTRWRWRS